MKDRLGSEAWNILIEETQKGSITSQHMKDISRAFGSRVGGNHDRRTNDQKVNCDDHELREILSDWWVAELFDLSPENALKRICEILKSSEVNLPAIASKLMSSSIKNPQDVILAAVEEIAPDLPSLTKRIKKIFESIQEQELRAVQTAEDAAEAYKHIDQQFILIVKRFKQNRDYACYTIEEVEDRVAGSFEIKVVKKFMLKEQVVQIQDLTRQMEVVKDSRLKLLIMQILLNPDDGRRVRQVVSAYNAHSDAYDLLEESFKLQEENRKKVLELKQERQMREELEMREKERKERKEKKRKEKEERRKNEEQRKDEKKKQPRQKQREEDRGIEEEMRKKEEQEQSQRREKEEEEERQRKLRRAEEEERIKEDLKKRQREENIKKSEDEELRKHQEITNAGGVW